MKRRWLRWTLIGLLSFFSLVALLLIWTVNTQSGTRWAFGIARSATNGALQADRIEGKIAGPLTLQGLRYVDAVTGLEIEAERIAIDLRMAALFTATVHVLEAEVDGLDVSLGAPQPEEESEPFTLEAPIDVVVDRFVLNGAIVRRESEPLVEIDSVELVGHWIDTSIAVRQLDVQSPQGAIHFAGEARDENGYLGSGEGRFRWRSGEHTFAGTLDAAAKDETAQIGVVLTSPLRANLNVFLQQEETMPWRFTLRIPSFDPRNSLLPDSSWHALAADLNGRGTLQQGVIQGEILLNGEPLRFESLAFAHQGEMLNLNAELALGGGSLHAKGIVRLSQEPVSAKLDARWDGIELPDQWAGQTLLTRGSIAFDGSSEAYRVNGSLSAGPPERVADIELRIEGTPAAIAIQQFDIVQAEGRLAARGRLNLDPELGWTIDATARRFDPGAFASEWGGKLNFTLASRGTMREAGPEATVVLQDLSGELRGRSVSGHADVEIATNKVISGTADLRSGKSRLLLNGDAGDAMNATVVIDVPALDDWVPAAGGALHGEFSARGTWPEMTIEGQARGRALRMNELRADTLSVDIDVTNPTEPRGSARVEVGEALAGGMEFSSFVAHASGDSASHSLQLNATGSPITTELSLSGARLEGGWSGTLENLVLDIENAPRLTLEQAVEITYTQTESRISEACFVEGEIRICFEGSVEADGPMQAVYSLRGVPLSLANAFSPAGSSLVFDGTLEGDGQVERNGAGEFDGAVRLRSSGGHVAQQIQDSDERDVLLSFADLNLDATLEGDRAQARLDARLDETGALQGELAASGLSQPATALDGRLTASLPSLSVIELFAPQLANVEGRAELRAGVSGTMDAPDLTGELKLTELAMDVPELGLQLKNGRASVTPREDGDFDLEGGIESGGGHVAFAGVASIEGTSNVSVEGKNFLAADMPGARVLIAPDLQVERSAERVSISGTLTIPEATINLQELPRGEGGGQSASSDVVIVDAKTQEEASAEALPIYAQVNVIVGDEVELSGFGLLAQVEGQLKVTERPGEPTTGSGEIRVDGTYKAYGQDLTIQRGQLLYANTPLDNPRLNIVATREVGDVTAGLRATGPARDPQITIFSDPAMGQADALSYLVAGKPIDQIGAGEGEGDAVQTAARSLGTAAGGLLAKNVGKRLGIDEFGIKDDEMIGGSAFTIGQYLSPRLYLSYGVGLFEPGEVVTLRYKLTDELALKAQSGSENSRAGIEYRMER